MKKHHFDAFQHEKHFEKQMQPHFQTGPVPWETSIILHNENLIVDLQTWIIIVLRCQDCPHLPRVIENK